MFLMLPVKKDRTRNFLGSLPPRTILWICNEEVNQQFALKTELGDIQYALLKLVIGKFVIK